MTGKNLFFSLAGLCLLSLAGLVLIASVQSGAAAQSNGAGIAGPFVDPVEAYPHEPAVFAGSLTDPGVAPVEDAESISAVLSPLRYLPGQNPKAPAAQNSAWIDPVAQVQAGSGSMPALLPGFAGLSFAQGGKYVPPDTNGDVGPDHYIQAVNIALGIYDRTSGSPLYIGIFDHFFTGPEDTPCDTHHRGDPVVLYDAYVSRWVVTDFAWYDGKSPHYQCIAVSRTADPVNGGWYFYALQADTGGFESYLNDYPKLGVWHDGWYMTANMFELVYPYRFGVRVWALDRQRMIQGLALREVHYDLCTQGDCSSLLPAHDNLAQAVGVGSPPNYLVAARLPDELVLWRFRPDFDHPAASSFSGPVVVSVAPFAIAASISQPDQVGVLDSLSYRLMMQLQYRFIRGVESLWLNHTVASRGLAAVRWYELQQPGSPSPVLAQQGTYQPEDLEAGLQRWMGSLAVDQDGNMALGYSAASETVYPSIRVVGRLSPETPGLLPQSELEVQAGGGAQLAINRWGDYSAMSVAPDGCTFYYTNQYFLQNGIDWQTWIVPFRYPSCGQPKGFLQGMVRDASSGQALSGIPVQAASPVQTLTVHTGEAGEFSLELAQHEYSVTAGPFLPGYPQPETVSGVVINAGETGMVDLALTPYPSLSLAGFLLEDAGPKANGNGVPEPGESSITLWLELRNDGAAAAEKIKSSLESLTPGVFSGGNSSTYADIQPGETLVQNSAYSFSLDPRLACGEQLAFTQRVDDSLQTYIHSLNFDAALSLERQEVFLNDVEYGSRLWHTEGNNNFWAITASDGAYSPTHAWSDSPDSYYRNYTDASLVSPAFNLTGKRRVRISFALKYSLEPGWDYLYLEYSLDGGQTWQPDPLAAFNGLNPGWQVEQVEAPVLDGQPQAALRFRLLSDMSIVYDGVLIDDLGISFEPFSCAFPVIGAPMVPVPLMPMAGELYRSLDISGVAFGWLPGPSGAPVDGYRLFIDGFLAGELPSYPTEVRIPVAPGGHDWTVQAYNEYGDSAFADLTQFWQPFYQVLPLVFKD